MELDPLYVDLAVRRWQEYTGKVAIVFFDVLRSINKIKKDSGYDQKAKRRPASCETSSPRAVQSMIASATMATGLTVGIRTSVRYLPCVPINDEPIGVPLE
jgi:hypothetical protein